MPDMQTALSNALKTTISSQLKNTINSQLKNTINDWEKDDMQATQQTQTSMNYVKGSKPFGITNNVTRATFDYMQKHPNLTSAEICADMEKLGYKESSVGSLLAQFAKQGLAERDDRGRYIVIVNEYRPLKAKKKHSKIVAKPVDVPKRKYTKRSEGIGALLKAKLESIPTPSQDALDAAAYAMGGQHRIDKPFLTKLVRTQSPESIVENLNVLQARELYDYLRKIFGG